ncbi:NCK-interacting protein with SH3 domain-like [Liolophura sinensis]|uniref:NCK-interacting protein with SH3 domain-like n=1 Tax=Liolophura sinensis TaxID=3198878 RepID=UPI003158101C
MYRALYDFSAQQKGCLSFKSGDLFTVVGDSSGDWIKVENGKGHIGLVPYNYVARVVAQGNGVVDDVLKSIDRAIEGIHNAAAQTGTYTKEQRKNLEALVEHRQKVSVEQTAVRSGQTTPVSPPSDVPPQPKRHAPTLNSPISSDQQLSHKEEMAEKRRSFPRREAPAPPPRTTSQLQTPQEPEAPTLMMDTPEDVTSDPLQSDIPEDMVVVQRPVTVSAQKLSAVSQSETSTCALQERHVPEAEVHDLGRPVFDTDFPSPPEDISTDFPHPPDFLSDASVPGSLPEDTMPVHIYTGDSCTTAVHAQPAVNAMSSQTESGDAHVPLSLGHDLLEDVRRNTGVSYDKTIVAVETVVKLISFHVPSTKHIMEKVSQVIYQVQEGDVVLAGCHDAERLQILFSELRDCKDDSQQRSWALYEDESIILHHLQEMISILENANPKLCRKCISADSYEPIHTLVQYYQMETRSSIRLTMLKGFAVLCNLDSQAVTALLYSVLPLELCRDLQSNITDAERTCASARVLTMILSMGEDIPVHHYVHLNKDFVSFLLDYIEAPPAKDTLEEIPNYFVNLILAFNLHFCDLQKNSVMVVLGERGTATVFTEKLMLLVNRGDDPVRMLPHHPKPANALLKFLMDMYGSPVTSDLLYTNDAMVLIDIIIRELADLPAGDQARTENLRLVRLILTNSPYRERKYRLDDLRQCLLNIVKEEEVPDCDANEVQKIFRSLPYLFPSCC